MSGESQNDKKTTGERKRLQGVARVVRRVKAFFGQRYVWLSLTVGFLWMFSIPFLVMLFLEVSGDSANQFAWIFQTIYFPFTLSLYLLSDVVAEEIWIARYGLSFLISMLFCLGIADIIRRIRIRTMLKSDSE